jgi:hypothetical protein
LIPSFLKVGAGNWKDIESRRHLLQSLPAEVEEHVFNVEQPLSVLDHVVSRPDHAIVEYSWWPSLIDALRKKFPSVNVHVRTHNAEAFQFLAQHGFDFELNASSLRKAYGFMRLAARDAQCRRAANSLWGISDWDSKHYWRWLPGTARLQSVPYVCPWPILRTDVPIPPFGYREPQMACMPGGSDRIGNSMQAGAEAFMAFGHREGLARGWRCGITAGLDRRRSVDPSSKISLLQEPFDSWDTLRNSRVLLVLGRYGFGHKTNITDGLAAGCHVVVHRTLFERLPKALQEQCIPCDPTDTGSMNAAWSALSEPPLVPRTFHESICKQASAAMTKEVHHSA